MEYFKIKWGESNTDNQTAQEDWKKPNGKGQKAKAGIESLKALTLKAPTENWVLWERS
jgi:hypothetical protein